MSKQGTTGLRVGPFALGELLAVGGMGEVHGGTHVPSGLPVAMKLVKADRISPRTLLEFEAEIRAQARIDHPGVLYLFDHGRLPAPVAEAVGMPVGAPWLAMERCSSSLAEVAAGLDWPGLRDVLLQLLDALAQAHAVGVLHRDLKISNVLVSTAEDLRPGVKLADFGIAHALADVDEETRPVGTPRYMAPEQVRGTWEDHGPWTDLYALGVLAWRLVTGRRPWARLEGSLLAHAMCTAPLGWPGTRLWVPPELRGWIEKATAKRPADRFQLAADAAAALRTLSDRPGPSRPLGPPAEPVVPRPRAPVIDPREDPPPESEASIRLHHAGLGMLPLRRPAFIGRRHERRVAWGTLRQVAQRGEPRALCVVGAPRVGRTRFLAWLAEAAERTGQAVSLTIPVLEGRSLDRATLAAVRAWFRVGGLEPEEQRDHLQSWLGEAPWLDDLMHLLRNGFAADDSWLGTVAAALGALGRLRPVILHVEGVAWAPEAYRLVSAVLAVSDARVLVVLDAELPGLPTLELGPLEGPAMHRLAMALVSLDPDVRTRLVERASGSPGFLVQTLVHWGASGRYRAGPNGFVVDDEAVLPPTLDLVATVRFHAVLAALPEGGRESLERALLLGDGFRLNDWAAVDGRGAARERVRSDVVRVLADRGLLEGHAEGYRIPSVPFREAVLREASPRLADHHERCARWLAEEEEARDLELGRHLLAAGRAEEALEPLYRGLVHEVQQHGDRAGLALATLLEQAVEQLSGPARIVWKARLDELGSGLLLAVGRLGEAEERARAALRTAETFGDADLAARAWARLGQLAARRGDESERARCLEQALERQRSVELPEVAGWWMQLAKAHLTRGDRTRWAACMAAAAEAADRRTPHIAALGRAAHHQSVGHIEGALADLDEAYEEAVQAGSARARLAVLRARAHTLLVSREREAAREVFEVALELALLARPDRVAVVLANLIALDLALGEPATALDRFERHAYVLPPGQDGSEMLVPAHCAALAVQAERRDWGRVTYHRERIERHGPWSWGALECNVRLVLHGITLLREAGRAEEAARLARSALARCGALDGQRVHARLMLLAGGGR